MKYNQKTAGRTTEPSKFTKVTIPPSPHRSRVTISLFNVQLSPPPSFSLTFYSTSLHFLLHVFSVKIADGQKYQKCSELTQFLQRKSQFRSNITLRTCFPSLFDVSTMLKIRCSCLGAFWGRQFRRVLKILPRCRWDTTAPPNIIISSVSRQALLMWVPIKRARNLNTGFCPEDIWRAAKWARVERVGELVVMLVLLIYDRLAAPQNESANEWIAVLWGAGGFCIH